MIPDVFPDRIARVRSALASHGIECLLVTHGPNVRYLTGFAGSAGWLLISSCDVVLIADARYVERVRTEQPWMRVLLATSTIAAMAIEELSRTGVARLGFEGEHLSYSRAEALLRELSSLSPRCDAAETDGIVESLRMVKDRDELTAIERACRLADAAMAYVVDHLNPGMTETEAAWMIERWLRENGSSAVPFPVIVASGPNSALPHAQPSLRPIRSGEPLVIDFGATVEGYCSDLTRTIFVDEIAPEYIDLYYTVLSAQSAVIASLRPGIQCADADRVARDTVDGGRYNGMFTHGLGHGVGLEGHEGPTLNSRSREVLAESMIFTVEPGIYVAGLGGVRIEDTVVLREGSAVSLTQFIRDDPVVHSKHAP